MKIINVVAAVIKSSDEKGQACILATKRGSGEFKGGWEFPGGKIEEGETARAALVREIKEELDADINVGDFLELVEYEYPTFYLNMECYWCTLHSDNIKLLEHEEALWLTKEQLDTVQWLPADIGLVETIKKQI